jgi:hypothetical protein
MRVRQGRGAEKPQRAEHPVLGFSVDTAARIANTAIVEPINMVRKCRIGLPSENRIDFRRVPAT